MFDGSGLRVWGFGSAVGLLLGFEEGCPVSSTAWRVCDDFVVEGARGLFGPGNLRMTASLDLQTRA